jgi:hypothetical protein
MMRCLLVLLALSLPSCVGDDSGPSAAVDAGGDLGDAAAAECAPVEGVCGRCDHAYCWRPCEGHVWESGGLTLCSRETGPGVVTTGPCVGPGYMLTECD